LRKLAHDVLAFGSEPALAFGEVAGNPRGVDELALGQRNRGLRGSAPALGVEPRRPRGLDLRGQLDALALELREAPLRGVRRVLDGLAGVADGRAEGAGRARCAGRGCRWSVGRILGRRGTSSPLGA